MWHCTVGEAQARCDAREFAEWVAEYQLEPFGEERYDLHAAIIACVIANVHAEKGKRFKPEDFMPRWEPKRMSKQQISETLSQFTEAYRASYSQHASARGRGT